VASLNANQVLNATAVIFKNTIDHQQSKRDKILISFNLLHNLKKQSDVFFCFGFLEFMSG